MKCLICYEDYNLNDFIKCKTCKNKICIYCFKTNINKDKDIFKYLDLNYKNKNKNKINHYFNQCENININQVNKRIDNIKLVKLNYNCFYCKTENKIRYNKNTSLIFLNIIISYLFNLKLRYEILGCNEFNECNQIKDIFEEQIINMF